MKPTLLFIHGFRGNGLGLEELAKKFPKKNFNVFVLEIPPAGGNTLREYSARLYARFIADYIKEHNLEKPILIGHSMGSIAVAAVAERYPELISDKVVFLAPISVKPKKLYAALSPLSAVLPNKLVGYTTTKYLYVPKNDKDLFKKTLEKTYISGKYCADKRTDIYKSAKFSINYSIDDFTFEKTALFLSGENDRLIPREKTEAVAKKFHGETAYVENAGHLLNYEAPNETAKIIKKFIKAKK